VFTGDVDAFNFGKGGAELLFGCIPAEDGAADKQRTRGIGQTRRPRRPPVKRLGELRVQ